MKKPQICRSTVPGDERTPPIKTELTAVEAATRAAVDKLLATIRAGEMAEIDLEELRDACKHHAFYDTPGFPYDVRYCAVCGSCMGCL